MFTRTPTVNDGPDNHDATDEPDDHRPKRHARAIPHRTTDPPDRARRPTHPRPACDRAALALARAPTPHAPHASPPPHRQSLYGPTGMRT